jgi:non-ribosomal peptide synthase protein (TIGR01720 family)
VDFNHGENTESSSASVSVTLSAGDTSLLLTRLLAARHTDINAVLLSALAGGYRRWCGASGLLVELEGHGREDLFEDVDLSRTLGWFTSLYPVYLPLAGLDPLEMLDDTTRRLQQIPHHGLTFGMLAYLSKDAAARNLLRQGARPQITFNYLGQMDQALGGDMQFFPAQESSGPQRSPAGLRRSLIDVNGGVAGGQLQLEWTYSRSLHRESTVRALAEQFMNALREIIHAGTADNTPDEADSVFGWSSSDIDDIFDTLEKGKNHPGSSHSPSQKAD